MQELRKVKFYSSKTLRRLTYEEAFMEKHVDVIGLLNNRFISLTGVFDGAFTDKKSKEVYIIKDYISPKEILNENNIINFEFLSANTCSGSLFFHSIPDILKHICNGGEENIIVSGLISDKKGVLKSFPYSFILDKIRKDDVFISSTGDKFLFTNRTESYLV